MRGEARWSTDQVESAAPDASSVGAGRKLATTAVWSGTGATATALWGSCAGSGKKPYRTIVDLRGPAFRCSCPSRKFPCKHALGLLLLWSAGEVAEAARTPGDAATWLDGRDTRAAVKATAPAKPADPERAAATAAQRADRVAGGIAELTMWLEDQVSQGFSGLDGDPYARFDPLAARLVDAQAPGLASRVRELPGVLTAGDPADWPDRLLMRFGELWALGVAHGRLSELDDDTVATVRRHVGYTVAKADVLSRPPVTDDWMAVGRRTEELDHITARHMWFYGADTGRYALTLEYVPTGGVFAARPPVGVAFRARLHFYPGSPGHRALIADENAVPGDPVSRTGVPPAATTIDHARRERARSVAADPWLRAEPATVRGRLAVAPGTGYALIDEHGESVALHVDPERWTTLVATTLGGPVGVVGELGVDGLLPLSVISDGQVIAL
ncbi:SWIM zinc finger family protein [Gordonia pseudamarae]|uniref:SWIM zinc finger family protein n=1 Tax=Gordonia pseudamarae TaxID=2831662 RepID=A0ABX6IPB3_9ACTN|nr:SWIM zinc finger family protein [Gordonia sp. (in: high G+C Gram-positive bacteria)]QHN28361.1 SWIM zinc finger family protein [Gordonia pseudamarae]QHN37229.1 SWIM zinc finger family protein [Gordonia pseudamarae]